MAEAKVAELPWETHKRMALFDQIEHKEPSTERMKRLKARCRWKHFVGGEYVDPETCVGIERMRYMTESYKQTEGDSEVERRAKMLDNLVKKSTIFIQDEEILAGYHAEHPDWVALYPDMGYTAAIDLVDSMLMTEESEDEGREYCEYWKPRGLEGRCEKYFNELETFIGHSIITAENFLFISIYQSLNPPYQTVLEDGLEKRIEMAERKRKDLMDQLELKPDKAWIADEMIPLLDKVNLYDGMIMAGKAMILWAKRYSRLCKIIAKNKDFDVPDWRREELLKMAEVCWHVPAKPVRGFWDAMQCKWFVYVMNHSFERYASGFAHKADDLLWPYYRRSVIEKDCQPMTREECVELVEEERLKISERGIAKGRAYRTGQPGANDLHILTIGGTDAQGRDLSNEVTKLYLEAALNVTTPEPSIMLRWHSGLDPEVKRLTFECIRRGFGFPSIKNDALNKWQLEYYFDATHEEASSWAVQLCMSPGITGRRETQKSRSDGGGELLQTKCLEMTFTDGFDYTFSNAQAGPHTGTPDNSWTIDDVWDAYRKQVAYAINHLQKNKDVTRWVEARWLESPLLSLIDDACMEKGVGALADRSRSNPWMNTLSMSDHADSFAAMEKLIFDEKKYTMDELVKALRANWEGYDEMRRDFIACPKWGNDDDYVDKWGERIFHMYFEEMHKNVNYNGKRPLPLPQTVALFSSLAPQTGPIPSGRRHGEVLGSGGIDPYMGMDKKGPTAVLKSVAKANHREMKGMQFNQRLSHELMRGEKGFALWSAYMDAWNELDADHVQFNVFKTEDLHDAQKEPEKYPDLLVRVAGYSVRFTSLAKLTQDAIIARNEQQLG